METDPLVLGLSLVLFIAVFALVEGLYLLFISEPVEGSVKLRRRLRNLSAGKGQDQKPYQQLRKKALQELPWTQRWLLQLPRIQALDRLLQQSGTSWTLSRLFFIQILLFALTFLILSMVTRQDVWFISLSSLAMGVGIPWLLLSRKKRNRNRAILAQFPDGLDFLVRALRAGNPFTAALLAASRELPAPISEEFGIIFDEVNYGLDLEDALQNFAARVGGADVSYFVTAVLIQRKTGGNLATIMTALSGMLRERQRTANEVQIQATEMRMSANVLIALPILVALFLLLFRPEYMTLLFTHPIGQWIVLAQLGFMLAGYFIIRSMIQFRI